MLLLIAQIGVVLAAARLVGFLFRRLRQPQVMGEMVAGICLGPSLLGWLAPEVSAALFPPASLGYLNALSQAGLLLFMFLVGAEFDPALLRGRGRAALVISHVSIVVPFLLGVVLALHLYSRLADPRVPVSDFALFMGAAMSATAFPVLARILTEHNLMRSRIGVLTIACAAVVDVAAWCLLAVVVGLVRAGEARQPLALTLGGSALYVGVMLTAARALLGRLDAYYASRGHLTQDLLAVILVGLLASAWTTEWLGIHALFGAFLFGAVLPRGSGLVRELRERLEDVTVVFLLPLFFAFTGLRTQIGLLGGGGLWLDCGLIVLIAIAGKLGGSTLAARASGLSWREAGALGILMNTRGLMELVILSIGLDLGVISPTLFAMMVLMALGTTFMTSPLLEWVYPRPRAEGLDDAGRPHVFTVLIPVAAAVAGPPLLRAALALAPAPRPRLHALHLRRAGDRSIMSGETDAADDGELAPLLQEAQARQLEVRPLAFVSHDLGRDIAAVARRAAADLIVMGWHKPVLGRNILGGTVASVLRDAEAAVVVYVARAPMPWRRVLVPYRGRVHDRAALELARRLARAGDAAVTVLHAAGATPPAGGAGARERLQAVEGDDVLTAAERAARRDVDVVLVGAAEPRVDPASFGQRYERLAAESPASLLIVRAAAAAQ